jgi:hypothetical protein
MPYASYALDTAQYRFLEPRDGVAVASRIGIARIYSVRIR